MPLVPDCTIIGTWPQVDGVVASGHVIVEPVQSVAGGGYIVVDVPVTVPLVAGSISKLFTSLAGVQLRITERIRGAHDVAPYVVTPVPGTLNLATAPRGAGDVVPTYVPGSAIGQPLGVAALDGSGKVPLAQLPAAGASSLVARRAVVTSGTLGGNTPPDTGGAWQELTGPGSLVIPAAVGDLIDFQLAALVSKSSTTFYDVAVKVGGSLVWFLSNNSAATPRGGGSGAEPER